MPSATDLRTNVLLRSEETGGHVSVTEIVVPPHSAGPPLHTHDFDEAFYMLEGELIFQVDDALVTKGASAYPLWGGTRRPVTAAAGRASRM
jgi:quercetin dioxygenase-like cupin family protein